MPIYDYRCSNCGNEYEGFRSVAQRDNCQCPKCNSSVSELLMSAPRIDPRMGTDPDFPTAYRKWGNNLRKRTTGQMRDSNNTAYGTNIDHMATVTKSQRGQ
jgi:putative FmdB family regulatory protein